MRLIYLGIPLMAVMLAACGDDERDDRVHEEPIPTTTDEYNTTPTDALHFADLVRSSEYVTIRQAGHFLELENEAACDAVAQAAEGFLSAGTQAPRLRRTA